MVLTNKPDMCKLNSMPKGILERKIFDNTNVIVDNLMGKNPEKRFKFIQEKALLNKEGNLEIYV